MSREQAKATFYIQQLEEARCQGNWSIVPELIRKVRKHAPHRSCLATTAESEHALAIAAQTAPTHEYLNRLSTVNSAKTSASIISGISKYILRLVEGIKKEQTNDEDVFQAQVCLSIIYWYLGEFDTAISNVPTSIGGEDALLFGSSKESTELTRLGILKALYVKANSHQKKNDSTIALHTYKAALPMVSGVISSSKQGNELLLWTELLLTDLCMLSSDTGKNKVPPTSLTDSLSLFRVWVKFWESQASKPIGGCVLYTNIPRRSVWKEYFAILSVILQYDPNLSLENFPTASHHVSSRAQFGAELKQIEAHYESLLVREVPFPKSHEASEEIEEFINIVMQNWQVLRGIHWKEGELGEGGIEAISRGTLDILYRAARKTFHSTAILRHLFTVHLAIAEFDLAFKAFDTYISLVKKMLPSVKNDKAPKEHVDDVEMVLRTISKFIEAICCYGSQQAIEKVREMSEQLESWINTYDYLNSNIDDFEKKSQSKLKSPRKIPPNIFAIAWRSAGIGYAQSARSTFDAASRSDIQAEAVKCFRKSLLPKYKNSTDPRTLFALGIILAERREISAAIEAVKVGLLPSSLHSSSQERRYAKRLARERLLIPLWHLLALLLSARQEFKTAKKSCEAVFEQFQSLEPNKNNQNFYSNQNMFDLDQDTIDYFDEYQKENLLEVKMTQLSLIELSEGPDVAVNSSDELLSLYRRLFGDFQVDKNNVSSETVSPVSPKSPTGTIKSFRNGIFGRSGQKAHANPKNPEQDNDQNINFTKISTGSKTPAIHVTSEASKVTTQRSLTVSGNDKSLKRSTSRLQKTDNNHFTPENIVKGRVRSQSSGATFTQLEEKSQFNSHGFKSTLSGSSDKKPDASAANTQRPISSSSIRIGDHNFHQLNLVQSKTFGILDNQDIENSEFLENSSPGTQFPTEKLRKRKLIILFRVWMLISGFYRRACMHDDALSAIHEAQQLVITIENSTPDDLSNNLSTDDWIWRTGKSIAELWGDIYAELGHLALAEGSPYSALEHYETALTHFRDHLSSIVSLSNILMDIYSKDLLPPPSVPALVLPKNIIPTCSPLNSTNTVIKPFSSQLSDQSSDLSRATDRYLGLLARIAKSTDQKNQSNDCSSDVDSEPSDYITNGCSFTSLLDRLAARDRAYGLLAAITKTGAGWNNSEVWFTLARACEESGQTDRAKEVLWWCVELEDSRAVRDWTIAGSGGYVL